MPHRNNIKPIDKLRLQKRALKIECKRQEDILAEHWDFLSDNAGILLFNSAIGAFRRRIGLGGKSRHESDEDETMEDNGFASSIGLGQKFMSGFMTAAPLLWEMIQPLLMKAAINKVKSFFSRKNRDDDYDYEDDDEYEEDRRRSKKRRR